VVNAFTKIFQNVVSQTAVRLPLLVRQPLFLLVRRVNKKSKYGKRLILKVNET
jgi:hypothetical protein